jgi:hypothetical protein
MKRNIKKFLFPAVAVAVLSFAACSDWTETESLDINYPTLEEQNPELYKQYLKALRDYKASTRSSSSRWTIPPRLRPSATST